MTITRRQFLELAALLSITYPFSFVNASDKEIHPETGDRFPVTTLVLKEAHKVEMMAHKHYLGYSQKAVAEEYPYIAYLFSAFAMSEKIHADNYKKILEFLGSEAEEPTFFVSVSNTKENLQKSAEKEMEKIQKTYPNFLKTLELESYDQAVINCMYSWKSHQQHEKTVKKISKYAGFFFILVAREIEKEGNEYYVCDVCGSTISEKPVSPCNICNFPAIYYKKVERPA